MTQVTHITVSIARQQLYCAGADGDILRQYPVSTARSGVGNQNGSFKTPLGEHCIEQKIGAGCAINEVFVGRQAMGALEDLRQRQKPLPDDIIPDDIITGRILRLRGLQPGINAGEGIDSFQRYIYIHGTPEEDKIGYPASHGCVRMRNKDVIELFGLVEQGCRVDIQEK